MLEYGTDSICKAQDAIQSDAHRRVSIDFTTEGKGRASLRLLISCSPFNFNSATKRVYTSFRKFDQPFPRSPDQREGRLFAKTLAMEELETPKTHFIGPPLKEGGYGSTLQAKICLNMRLTHM